MWLRLLESGSARAVKGTDGADAPFWSPDSASVAFFDAEGTLRRLDLNGESVTTLAVVVGGLSGSWSRDGVILFAQIGSPLSRLPATATTDRVIRLVRQGGNVRHFCPMAVTSLLRARYPEARGVYVGDPRRRGRSPPLTRRRCGLCPPGMLFVRQETLFAQRFDPIGWN